MVDEKGCAAPSDETPVLHCFRVKTLGNEHVQLWERVSDAIHALVKWHNAFHYVNNVMRFGDILRRCISVEWDRDGWSSTGRQERAIYVLQHAIRKGQKVGRHARCFFKIRTDPCSI